MILADKIIALRKKAGWSQEELAHQLSISRQALSKWETGTSIPDLDKIVKLSQIFGVTTDYLLQESIEEMPIDAAVQLNDMALERSLSLNEVAEYLEERRPFAKILAYAVMSYVLCPVPIILLAGLQESGLIPLTENAATGFGMIALLLIVAAATVVIVLQGMKMSKYEWMEKENFRLEYGGEGLVRKQKDTYAPTFRSSIAGGVGICIVAVIPIFIALVLGAADIEYVICTAILLGLISVAVHLFVRAGTIWDTFEILLEEGDHTREKKELERSPFAPVYWCIVTAIYLSISFLTGAWSRTWIVWPVAGCLFAAAEGILAAQKKARG